MPLERSVMVTYRINEIKCNLNETTEILPYKIAKKAGIPEKAIESWEIVRESVDARKKQAIKKVYTVDFTTNRKLKLEIPKDRTYHFEDPKTDKSASIVITGFGPCGMFCGLVLAQMGYKPIILEQGADVDTRTEHVHHFWEEGVLHPYSNVQFGEGGAGTFSDGKLTTGINDPRIQKVLREFVNFGAPEEILYKQKPHIGTDILKGVVKNLREEIKALGGEVLFLTKVTDLLIKEKRICGVRVLHENEEREIPCDHLVMAVGHSARNTFQRLHDLGVHMEQKPFSMGVRIEHPQTLIDESQYGNADIANILGPAEYKLNARTNDGRGVYTFCMCPGGEVVMASSSPGQVLSNGMSYHARDLEYANAGLLVDVRTSDYKSEHPLAGVQFQEEIEHKAYTVMKGYALPTTTIANFKDSTLGACLPNFVVDSIVEALPLMGRKLKGFDAPQTTLKGPETRSSSPVRILRDETFQSNLRGLYPAGEGAGYAGGIMSAAVDGIRIAEQIARGE